MDLDRSSRWMDHPRVQTALFRLPYLKTCSIKVGSGAKLLPSAVALASKLVTLDVEVPSELTPDFSLRALRLAPALATLRFGFAFGELAAPLPRELMWWLPPTLTQLELWNIDLPRDVSLPLIKALFSRTPLLQLLELKSASIEAVLRGLLDAGVNALPSLRCVFFQHLDPVDFSVGIDPDPLMPIFRRFMHRFPQVTVRLEFSDSLWLDSEELRLVQMRYVGWAGVQMYRADSDLRIGGPRTSHASDDEERSDVEELIDPLAAEEH